MKNRLFLAAAASGLVLVAVVGVAVGVGRDEPRLVRTAGESTPIEETSTTSTSVAHERVEDEKVAELDATVENHEARIRVLESTTTTAPAAIAAPTATTTVVPAPAVSESTTTTITAPSTTTTTQAAPTTTTTWMHEPWWCRQDGSRNWVPCDSTTATTAAQ